MTKKIKNSIAVLLFFLMTGLIAYNIQRNPADGAQKLTSMERTASSLLNLGGNVVEKQQKSKYGGALITLLFDSKGWSSELVKKYEDSLVNDGWKIRESGVFCRDSVELEIVPHSSEKDGRVFNFVGISYNAITIKDCG